MAGLLDAFVPASYSLYFGLESLVGTFKDGTSAQAWQALPLGSVLWALFSKHGSHIEDALGPDPIYTWVPSNNRERGFDHIEQILRGVQGFYEEKPWDSTIIRRNYAVERPDRKQVSEAAYTVSPSVNGRPVLLLDDLWTTGASLTSAAAALRSAGATRVVGVTVGRQFSDKSSFGRTQEIYDEIRKRSWKIELCPLCA